MFTVREPGEANCAEGTFQGPCDSSCQNLGIFRTHDQHVSILMLKVLKRAGINYITSRSTKRGLILIMPDQDSAAPIQEDEAPVEVTVEDSSQVQVPPSLIDQVIGQEHAVEVIRKAAIQRRHVMMIGSPGTGKSMLAKAMAELLPKEEMQDILVYPNSDDPNNPIVRTVPAGRGKQIVAAHKAEAKKKIQFRNTLLMLLLIGILGYAFIQGQWLMGILAAAFVFMALRYATPREESMIPKLIVSNDATTTAPFIDAPGPHAGALGGDGRPDPCQRGGL
jgi:Lon-like ATP-dependent protease